MPNLNYMNPEGMMPDSKELAGGEGVSPAARAYTATLQAHRAMPFLQEALAQTRAASLEATTRASEFVSPLASQLRESERQTGLAENVTKQKLLQNQKADLEAADIYPIANKVLGAVQSGKLDEAENLYSTYIKSKPPGEVPPEAMNFRGLTGEPNEQVMNVLNYAKQRVENTPALYNEIAKNLPEIQAKKDIAQTAASASVASAGIQGQYHLEAIKMQLNKTDAGLFSTVITKLRSGEPLDVGDKMVLNKAANELFNQSPGGKMMQTLSTAAMIKGLDDPVAGMAAANALSQNIWSGFLKQLPPEIVPYINSETAMAAPSSSSIPKASAEPTTSKYPKAPEGTPANKVFLDTTTGKKVQNINGFLVPLEK